MKRKKYTDTPVYEKENTSTFGTGSATDIDETISPIYTLQSDNISEVKSEVSALVSSVKALEREKKINKARRWKSALKRRR